MANYHELNIQDLAIKMIDGDTQAKNQIINYYSNYINDTIDRIFKDIEYDKDLIREKMLQYLYNCIKNYDNTKYSYFSTYIVSYILNTAKVELRKIKNKENSKNREIQKLAERMINGDNDSLNQIIEFYTSSIKKIVRDKYSDANYEEEDLIQIGIIGLLKAINFYKSKQENYFCIHANNFINREIERKLNSSNKFPSIEYIGLTNNYNIKIFNDFIENVEVKEAIEKLSLIKKKVLILHIYGNCSFDDISQMLGFSRSRAHEHYKKAIESIKQELDLPIEKQKKL